MIKFTELPDDVKRVSNAWGAVMIGRTWLIIVAAVAMVGISNSGWAWLLAFFVIGVMQYHLSVLGHHAMHQNLFSSVNANEATARILLLAPQGLSLPGARANHLRHHVLFQEEGDYERDNYNLQDGGRDTPLGLIRWLLGAYLGAALIPAAKRVLRGEVKAASKDKASIPLAAMGEWALIALTQGAILLSMYAVTGRWYAYIVLWILPLFTVALGLSVSRATLEHADLGEPPQRLMTFPAGPIQRFLWGPFNFNFHAEHHAFPGIPACNLEKLHHVLMAKRGQDSTSESEHVVVSNYTSRFLELFRQCRERHLLRALPIAIDSRHDSTRLLNQSSTRAR